MSLSSSIFPCGLWSAGIISGLCKISGVLMLFLSFFWLLGCFFCCFSFCFSFPFFFGGFSGSFAYENVRINPIYDFCVLQRDMNIVVTLRMQQKPMKCKNIWPLTLNCQKRKEKGFKLHYNQRFSVYRAVSYLAKVGQGKWEFPKKSSLKRFAESNNYFRCQRWSIMIASNQLERK